MEFALVAADGVDLGDAIDQHQLGLDDPVLHGAQRHGVPGRAIVLPRTRRGGHGVHEDLAQTGCNRAHGGLQTGRELALDGPEALVDEIAREVDVRAFLEHHRHLRQAIAGQRSGVGQTR